MTPPWLMKKCRASRSSKIRHDVDGLTVFVSRGVGGSLVPMRTYAPPDVALFTIDGGEP